MKNVSSKRPEQCCGCMECELICPVHAISRRQDENGFCYPKVVQNSCIDCGKCAEACSFDRIDIECEDETKQRYYIAQLQDTDLLQKSSSGGVFDALAQVVLADGGVVYGAVFDTLFRVVHARATTEKEKDAMKGSKYVQSDIYGVYEQIKDDLKREKKVLFTGTPCQVSAIKSYLHEQRVGMDKLYLCDLICHGVCSPLVWNQYISWISAKIGQIKSVNMRDKRYGSGYQMSIEGENGRYIKHGVEDPFISLFQKNLPLRPSCFSCPMKRYQRIGDVTIGDFQKAKQFYPSYARNGASLIIINTSKGGSLFSRAKEFLIFEETVKEKTNQVNLTGKLDLKPEKSMIFFKSLHQKGFNFILKKYTLEGMLPATVYYAKSFIKRIIKRG